MQRLRLRYAKRGAARFSSHRDVGRALERALRRASIPMAYSSGFTPHPRISYANASPTSAASEAEYVELGLSQHCDPAKVMSALNEVLPPGFVVLAASNATGESLTELLQASDWRITLPAAPGILADAVARLATHDEFPVERMTKNGLRRFDVLGAIVAVTPVGDDTVLLRLRHLVPAVRPDDVVGALRQVDSRVPGVAPLLERLRQGVLEGDEILDPLQSRG